MSTMKTLQELGILNVNINETDIVRYNTIDHVVTVTNGEFSRVNPNDLVNAETFRTFADRIDRIISSITDGSAGGGKNLEFRVIGGELQWRYEGDDGWNIVANSASWKGDPGDVGMSAYQLAVKNGFVGTEEQWLDTIVGKSAYQIAVKNGFVGTEEQWLASLKGKTVYETMIEHGWNGSEEEFYKALKELVVDVVLTDERFVLLKTISGTLIGTGFKLPDFEVTESNADGYMMLHSVDGKNIYNKNIRLEGNQLILNGITLTNSAGSAMTAERLQHPFNFALAGDLAGSVSLDGGEDVSLEALLKSSPVFTGSSAPSDNIGRDGAVYIRWNPRYFVD